MKTLFPCHLTSPLPYLDTALIEFISQFSFTAFYNLCFSNGRVFAKLPKRLCHNARITDSNPKIIELLTLIKYDATDPQIPQLCSELGGTTNVPNQLINDWSQRLKTTKIMLQQQINVDQVTPTDLLFVQPPNRRIQDEITKLLPYLTTANHNWILTIPNDHNHNWDKYNVFKVLGGHWLIIYNKGEQA